jgi:hypothetical protein
MKTIHGSPTKEKRNPSQQIRQLQIAGQQQTVIAGSGLSVSQQP